MGVFFLNFIATEVNNFRLNTCDLHATYQSNRCKKDEKQNGQIFDMQAKSYQIVLHSRWLSGQRFLIELDNKWSAVGSNVYIFVRSRE